MSISFILRYKWTSSLVCLLKSCFLWLRWPWRPIGITLCQLLWLFHLWRSSTNSCIQFSYSIRPKLIDHVNFCSCYWYLLGNFVFRVFVIKTHVTCVMCHVWLTAFHDDDTSDVRLCIFFWRSMTSNYFEVLAITTVCLIFT
jgi:hypothetical protein